MDDFITSHPRILNDLPNHAARALLRRVLITTIHSPAFLTHKINTTTFLNPHPLPFFGDHLHAATNHYTLRTLPLEITANFPTAETVQILIRTAKRADLLGDVVKTRYLIVATVRVWDADCCTVVLPPRYVGDLPEQAVVEIRVEWTEGEGPDVSGASWGEVVRALRVGVNRGFDARGDRMGYDVEGVRKMEVW